MATRPNGKWERRLSRIVKWQKEPNSCIKIMNNLRAWYETQYAVNHYIWNWWYTKDKKCRHLENLCATVKMIFFVVVHDISMIVSTLHLWGSIKYSIIILGIWKWKRKSRIIKQYDSTVRNRDDYSACHQKSHILRHLMRRKPPLQNNISPPSIKYCIYN